MSAALTGGVLLKCAVRAPSSPDFEQSIAKVARDCVPLAESVAAHAALEAEESYIYLFSRESAAVGAAVLARVAERAGGVAALAGAKLAAASFALARAATPPARSATRASTAAPTAAASREKR